MDGLASERHLDRLVLTLADDRQPDLGIDGASHLAHRLTEREALNRLVVELGDEIAGQNAGLCRRGLVDRRDHLDQTVLHGDLDPEAAELALGIHLHFAEAVGIHVARMRIEPAEHAVDRTLDELGVFGLFDVIRAHPLEYVAEQAELPIHVLHGGRIGNVADRGKPRLSGQQSQRRTRGRAE